MIREHQREHRLDDRHRARQHARVVTAARLEHGRVAVRSTVGCGRMIVAVGLNATRTVTGSPLEMPPWMPPL
jgi:hypothetical protein